ncbi:hypothetical protein [Pseudogemmobacter humi]|uniref:Uncharacterized protein n=1 Tax=Pseudogemmobacter humi TaxID=2483812 RepID=A0A3P5XFN5_9RHOB|nr:hypothetical protein [Pseudogemmobacter humi]VDC30235.1 hypothetical protein XINFAN_02494 [Pseudogemmobacter humi]
MRVPARDPQPGRLPVVLFALAFGGVLAVTVAPRGAFLGPLVTPSVTAEARGVP